MAISRGHLARNQNDDEASGKMYDDEEHLNQEECGRQSYWTDFPLGGEPVE